MNLDWFVSVDDHLFEPAEPASIQVAAGVA